MQNRPSPNHNQGGPSPVGQNRSLEDMMKELAANQLQNQAENKSQIAEIQKQVSQLNATVSQLNATVSEMKKETGRLLSQTVQNSRGNVSAITLRNGKKLIDELENEEEGSKENEEDHPGFDLTSRPSDAPQALGTSASPVLQRTSEGLETLCRDSAPSAHQVPGRDPVPSAPRPETEGHEPSPVLPSKAKNYDLSIPLPFPVPTRAPKRYVMDKDVWELFSRVEINIPLLEAIKRIPRYAKFLKELCTNRRRGTCVDQELMSRNISAVIQRTVPPKCGDPGTYTIPCTIGNIRIENCMLDLGASINVLPYSIYSSLRIGPLEPAGLTIQLADRSCKQPEGKIEDVLVQVGELVFPADFYVLKMENCGPNDHAPILLG
ncbi:unnamed protein product [Rhodiola kirilowii]